MSMTGNAAPEDMEENKVAQRIRTEIRSHIKQPLLPHPQNNQHAFRLLWRHAQADGSWSSSSSTRYQGGRVAHMYTRAPADRKKYNVTRKQT